MQRTIAAKILLALALACSASASASASAWGWWDRCDGYCYGPPYGNYAPPQIYVYDHRVGPTWTGNGWAYLPVGTYTPAPPVIAPPPPQVVIFRQRRPHPLRRHRPLK